jgi:uncharacterized delta-60 repeat protein
LADGTSAALLARMLKAWLLLCLVACGKVSDSSPDAGDDPSKSLVVSIDPAPHYVRTGGRQTIAVALTRENVTGPVTVEVANPPDGVTIEPITIDGDAGELVVDAAADSPFARNNFEVIASAGGETAMAPLAIEVIGLPGVIDPTFGTDGIATFAGSDKNERPWFAIAQGDRVVVGIAISRAGKHGVLVVRRLREGSPDPDFGITGDAGETFLDLSAIGLTSAMRVHAIAHPDGRIAIAGDASNGSNTVPFIARLTPDGQLDPTLVLRVANSSIEDDSIHAVTIGPTDEIMLAGTRQNAAGDDVIMMRIDASGELDRTFGSNGLVRFHEADSDRAHGVVVQADGRIVLLIETRNSKMLMGEYSLRRFGRTGQVDGTFGTDGKSSLPTPDQHASGSVLVSPDRLNLLVAGSASMDLTTGELAIWRFLADGRLDLDFAGGVGYWMSPMARSLGSLVIAPDGSLFGFSETLNPSDEPAEVWRVHLDATGVPDPAFGTGGIAHDTIGINRFRAVAMRADHRSIIVSSPGLSNDANDTVLRSYWH